MANIGTGGPKPMRVHPRQSQADSRCARRRALSEEILEQQRQIRHQAHRAQGPEILPRERGAAVSTQWRDARMALVHDHVRHDAIAVVEKVPPLQKTIQLLPAA